MKTERELFEAWYSSAYSETICMLPNGQYSSLRCQHSWDAWQASAQREGCRLVPVESTKEHIHKFEEITVNGDDARKYICIYCGFEKSESFND